MLKKAVLYWEKLQIRAMPKKSDFNDGVRLQVAIANITKILLMGSVLLFSWILFSVAPPLYSILVVTPIAFCFWVYTMVSTHKRVQKVAVWEMKKMKKEKNKDN